MTAFRGSASPTQSWNHFRFAVEDGVATVIFDRPKKLNALTFQVYADLRDLFTKVGLSGGDMGAAYLLPRLIGLGRATELLLLGEQVTAQRALAFGLANAVVEDRDLATETSDLAKRLAKGPALAYAATKMLI